MSETNITSPPYPFNESSFNALKHQIPRFTLAGYQKHITNFPTSSPKHNILEKTRTRFPEWWSPVLKQSSVLRTRTKLLEERRKERLPDLTYDLDGDGVVGGKDYFLAKRFDEDGDGRLNTKERQKALSALKAGYEDQFVWGVEKCGILRGERILQVRGQIVDAGDYSNVTKTYPIPVTTKPKHSTVSELKEQRKRDLIKEIREQKEKWDKANPCKTVKKYAPSEFFVESPVHVSVNQIKEENKRNSRIAAGLTETPIDFKNHDKDPTGSFVEDPVHKSRLEYWDTIKKNRLEELRKIVKREYKTGVERLKEREDGVVRMRNRSEAGKTIGEIREKRRKEMLDYNLNTFGNRSIGIHRKELPKFSEDETWKNRKRSFLSATTALNSQAEIKARQTISSPVTRLQKYPEIPLKVNQVNLFTAEAMEEIKANKLKYEQQAKRKGPKWTTLVQQFSLKTKGAYEEDLPAISLQDKKPMYSSFSPDGIFADPLDKTKNRKDTTRSHSLNKTSAVGRTTRQDGGLLARVKQKKECSASPDVCAKKLAVLGVITGGF